MLRKSEVAMMPFFLVVALGLLQGCNDSGTSPGTDGDRFLAMSEDYLDPDNWSNDGRVPGPGETALVDGATAVIDPGDPTPLPLGNLTLRNGARLIARGAVLEFETLDSNASSIEIFDSHVKADTFIDPGGFGIKLNPSFLEAEHIRLYEPETRAGFGLGGTEPAASGALGPGHYARMEGRSIALDGQLDLFLLYGFYPEPGDTFEIISNTGDGPISGTFTNAPEGSVIDGFCSVRFRITYEGGDGNDVVLTAEEQTTPDPDCDSGFDDPSADRNVVLDNTTADLRPGGPVEVNDILLRGNTALNLYDGVLSADVVDACSADAVLNLYDFDLKANLFYYGGPGGIRFNPSVLEADRIVVCDPEAVSRFGLGGTEPAGPDARGPGHYARMEGHSVALDGRLDLSLLYGFWPQPGDTFEIIGNTGDSPIRGTFVNAPEGTVIGGFCTVQFRITYEGGDGNDVVLTAEARTVPDPDCEEGFDDPSANRNVVLANTAADLRPGGPVEVKDIILRDGTALNLYGARMRADVVDANGTGLNLYDFHLKANVFYYGGFGVRLNPSFLEADRIVLHDPDAPVRFGLGGVLPAAEGALGAGRYARMQGDTVQLDGELELRFLYGFAPQDGQTFEIVTVNNPDGLGGTFSNAPEGAVVGGYCDIALSVSYTGGDGNDVVLTAAQTPSPDPGWPCE